MLRSWRSLDSRPSTTVAMDRHQLLRDSGAPYTPACMDFGTGFQKPLHCFLTFTCSALKRQQEGCIAVVYNPQTVLCVQASMAQGLKS